MPHVVTMRATTEGRFLRFTACRRPERRPQNANANRARKTRRCRRRVHWLAPDRIGLARARRQIRLASALRGRRTDDAEYAADRVLIQRRRRDGVRSDRARSDRCDGWALYRG